MYWENPDFWSKSPLNLFWKWLLKPLSRMYLRAVRRNYAKPYENKSETGKVIAVGAVTMGGSGKTAVAASICDILRASGKKVAILSRGYGRNCSDTTVVDALKHTFKEVGDEPLLLSRRNFVVVGKNRGEDMRLAEKQSQTPFDFFILDDGITQRSLQPDIRLIVIDNKQQFGNGEVFPLGPNRLLFDDIKHEVNAVICLRNENDAQTDLHIDFPKIITGFIKQDYSGTDMNEKYYAFCGIGYPEKFFSSLERLNVVKTKSYPDHYPYTNMTMYRLTDEAQNLGAKLITTEKDFMRIPEESRKFISVVPIEIVWDNIEELKQILLG